tara:strand:- start:1042 stop:1959 length:918 start_codon:yes stop_codon:yes gene_type:complete
LVNKLSITIKIATRKSALALWQANYIAERILAVSQGISIELVEIVTNGDRWLDGPLHEMGGKGLFVKELELALVEGRADIAVHSVKDIPAVLPDDFYLPVLGFRDSYNDVLVGCNKVESLAQGAVVGSSSLRRKVQLKAIRPDLEIRNVRGNVGTRLKKLDDGDFDALVLAEAGLNRLNIAREDKFVLPIETCLPAPGQGALGIEMHKSNPRKDIIDSLRVPETYLCIESERMVSAGLGADCSMPVAALASVRDGTFELEALVADSEGSKVLRAKAEGRNRDQVVSKVLSDLFDLGAQDILDTFS